MGHRKLLNVQVIDSALNCTFGVFAMTPEEFSQVFPLPGQDIEFAEDLVARIGDERLGNLLLPVWERPVLKPDLDGLHGTLFYGFDERKPYFPASKREYDWDTLALNSAQRLLFLRSRDRTKAKEQHLEGNKGARCSTDGGDFRVGRVVTRDYRFTRERIVAYAEMAGDPNPLHHDEDVAAKSRFGKLIACAAHSTGVLTSLLAASFSQDGRAVGLGFTFTLRRAVAVETDAVLEWRIESVEDSQKPRGRVMLLTGQIRDRNGSRCYLEAEGRMLVLEKDAGTEDLASAEDAQDEGDEVIKAT